MASRPDPMGRDADLGWEEWRRLSPRRKLRFGFRGLAGMLRELWQHGWLGRLLAVVAIPCGVVYVVCTAVRDAIVYREGARLPRRAPDTDAYVRHRFGGTQRLVRWSEERVVGAMLDRLGSCETALDVPSGYGRFGPLLRRRTGGLVSADVDRRRLAALRRTRPHGTPPPVVAADVAGALPFRTGAFDLVFAFRYLHHVRSAAERDAALAELARVSNRWVVVSYYRRPNLHSLVQMLQRATRGNRRRRVTMVRRGDFVRATRAAGLRPVRERAILPGLHAQRVVLFEKVVPRAVVAARAAAPPYTPSASSARSVTQ